MKAIAAFFDIDGTLYRDSLMIEHFKKLIKYEVIDPALWHTHVKKTYRDWQKRVGDYEDYMEDLAAVYVNALTGLKKDDLEFISQQVVSLKGDRVYSYARDRIQWHQTQGHLVFFISGSPDHLVCRMAKKYEVTDYRGTKYLLDNDGNFTGDLIPNWDSTSKNIVLTDFVKKYNINLEQSYAYGDTNGDLSMMQLSGHAVAINPTYELLENIRANKELCKKTAILIERKDVIYKLDPHVATYKIF